VPIAEMVWVNGSTFAAAVRADITACALSSSALSPLQQAVATTITASASRVARERREDGRRERDSVMVVSAQSG
jgi:hypothetical protein